VVLTETFDSGLLGEDVISSLADAWSRLIDTDCQVCPSVCLYICLSLSLLAELLELLVPALELFQEEATLLGLEVNWPINTGSTVGSAKDVKSYPYSIAERRVPELIPVLGSQPAGDVSHKSGGRLPLLSARPAVTPLTLKRAATNFAAW